MADVLDMEDVEEFEVDEEGDRKSGLRPRYAALGSRNL